MNEETSEDLLGPVEVGRLLGVKPQVVVNWIREGRARPSAVDSIGRNRFTPDDVAALRAGLGRRRDRAIGFAPTPGAENGDDAG